MTNDATVLQTLQQITNWGILTTDVDLTVTSANAWFQANTGRPADQIVGRNLLEVFPELAARKLDDRYRQVLTGGTVVLSQRLHGYLFSMTSRISQGQVTSMQQSAQIAPLLNDGQVVGTLTVVEDVTERVQLETGLRERAAQLAMADQRKNEFLAMLAHELRNPLAPIESAVQILRLKGSHIEEVLWAGEVIGRQVQQMTRLVNDLLDVSRITTGKINLHTERVELQRLVETATEISRPVIESHRHRFDVVIDPQPVWLNGDLPRLVQALSNILNNAAKYTPHGGSISLTAGRENAEVVIRVRDSGVGIPAAMLPRVFDLFTQVDRSIDRSEGGLGIGLTLVRKVMELHAGSVQVFSEGTDRGSEFVLRLPALPAEETAAQKQSSGSNRSSTATPRNIVVVDDNVDCAKSLAVLLKTLGNTTRIAFSGTQALEMIGNDPPDMVFMDIGLPEMNGHEVARRLRKNARLDRCHLVAISGYGQETDIQTSVEAGFDCHLVKPMTLENLLELLNRLPAAR